MVGIYKYECGLNLVAVCETKEKAIKFLYAKYSGSLNSYLTPLEWWKMCERLHTGCANAFKIKEVEVWE